MAIDPETGSRCRVNARQTAKNQWQIEGTFEHKNDTIHYSADPADLAKVVSAPLGLALLNMIKQVERTFREDGRSIVGETPPPVKYREYPEEAA